MKKISLLLLVSISGIALYSCACSIPRADEAHEAWAQRRWNGTHLSEARKVYANNCSGCHTLHSPMEHTQKEWGLLYAEMEGKAHMNARDSIAVFAYLESFSKDTNPNTD